VIQVFRQALQHWPLTCLDLPELLEPLELQLAQFPQQMDLIQSGFLLSLSIVRIDYLLIQTIDTKQWVNMTKLCSAA
jgi:hypothetical protein